MRIFVERVNFELLAKPLLSFCVPSLPQVNTTKVVIGKLMEGIDFDRLLKSIDRQFVFSAFVIGQAKIIPSRLALGTGLDGSVQEANREFIFSALSRFVSVSDKLVRFHVGGR